MSDELVLYTNPMSRGRIARWMLEEVGAPYRAEILEYASSMKSPEYLAINPMGKVPAILATVIYALPPMIRLTALGIEQVPFEIKEAATAFGVTPAQMLLTVELPLARPSIMAGVKPADLEDTHPRKTRLRFNRLVLEHLDLPIDPLKQLGGNAAE